MKNKLKKGLLAMLGMMLMLTMISCKSNDDSSQQNYLRCNATSTGKMGETESGFYFLSDSHLYYADKTNMSNWVSVCNKPDCSHEQYSECYANIGFEIVQKGEDIYYYDEFSIWKVAKDGSSPSVVFELPIERNPFEGCVESGIVSQEAFILLERNPFEGCVESGIVSQEAFILHYETLEEDGLFSKSLYRLEEDGSLHTLFTQKSESSHAETTLPSSWNHVRGDLTIMSSLLLDQDVYMQNVLFRVDGDEPERVNLPEDVSVNFSYLTENTFTYYRANEGFFEIDLESNEETFLMKNQLEDAIGYILTEDYIVECNRYNECKPEETYIKFFDGEKWIDVGVPEVVANTDCPFYPLSVASDRIFFALSKRSTSTGIQSTQLYYFMLGEQNPKLQLATTIGEESAFEITESDAESEENSSQFKEIDVTLLDTEECFAKVTGIGFDPNNSGFYNIRVYCENKTDKTLTLRNDYISINGFTFMLGKVVTAEAHKTAESTYSVAYTFPENVDYGGEFTNILISSYVDIEGEYGTVVTTPIYPYGEDKAIVATRKPLPINEVIIDNEFVRVTVIDYWNWGNQVSSDKESDEKSIAIVACVIENKTKDRLFGGVSEILSINGNPTNSGSRTTTILPESFIYHEISLHKEALDLLKIEHDIKEYSVKFSFWKVVDTINLEDCELLFEVDEFVFKPEE